VTIGDDGSLIVSNTGDQTIVAAGIDLRGDRVTGFVPSHSCNIMPGLNTIDWALPALLLGIIVARKRIEVLFIRLRVALRRLSFARAG